MDGKNATDAYKEPVPYIVYEGTMVRLERTIKRLIVVIIITVVIAFATNLAWLHVFNSYDVITEDVAVDSQDGGNANYIGASGIINNGESSSQKDGTTKEK